MRCPADHGGLRQPRIAHFRSTAFGGGQGAFVRWEIISQLMLGDGGEDMKGQPGLVRVIDRDDIAA
jgi:hypothetical protein